MHPKTKRSRITGGFCSSAYNPLTKDRIKQAIKEMEHKKAALH
jgi:hypothetical protein